MPTGYSSHPSTGLPSGTGRIVGEVCAYSSLSMLSSVAINRLCSEQDTLASSTMAIGELLRLRSSLEFNQLDAVRWRQTSFPSVRIEPSRNQPRGASFCWQGPLTIHRCALMGVAAVAVAPITIDTEQPTVAMYCPGICHKFSHQ